jgi:hypothetical protein
MLFQICRSDVIGHRPIKGFRPVFAEAPARRTKYFVRRGFAQAGLKLRQLTACPVLQWGWFFLDNKTVSDGRGWGEGENPRGGEILG